MCASDPQHAHLPFFFFGQSIHACLSVPHTKQGVGPIPILRRGYALTPELPATAGLGPVLEAELAATIAVVPDLGAELPATAVFGFESPAGPLATDKGKACIFCSLFELAAGMFSLLI